MDRILFINDSTDKLESHIISKLFADDVTVHTNISHPDPHIHFQSALDTIMSWSSDWQLPVLKVKSNLLIIGKPVKTSSNLDGTSTLNTVSSVRNLGIMILILNHTSKILFQKLNEQLLEFFVVFIQSIFICY